MYYPASATLAAQHPDLAQDFARIDAYLADLSLGPLAVETMADLLGMSDAALARLLTLYAHEGVLLREERFICPVDGAPLQPNEADGWYCDRCDAYYPPDDCEQRLFFHLLLLGARGDAGADTFKPA